MGQKESSISDDSVNSESEIDLKTDSNNTNTIPREWYDDQLLKRCKNVYFDVETFYTEFIPIFPSLAQAFINFYQTRYTSNKLLNSNDIQLIISIQNQLKEQIFNSKTNQFQNNETFIRLSSRSPKDGMPLGSRKIRQFYHQKLNELQIKYANDCLLVCSISFFESYR